MTWFKVDDGFWSHPKTLMLEPSAIALWVKAGTWSCQHLTDGFIPSHALPLFGYDEFAAVSLVESGHWDGVRGGYEFHDWAEYQEASGIVKARREVRTEASAKANHVRWHERTGKVVSDCEYCSKSGSDSDPSADSARNPPDPTRPDPTRPSEEAKASSSKAREIRLPADWSPTAEHIKRAKDLRVDIADAVENFRLHAETHDRHAASWNGAFTTWLKKTKPTSAGPGWDGLRRLG